MARGGLSHASRLAAAALLGLVGLVSAAAQPAGKVPRIAFLASGTTASTVHEGFRQGLRELGWVDGQNVLVEYRFAGGNDRLPAAAADLVETKPDLIVALATPATTAARNATGTIPIVMIGIGDPVSSGFIASFARPGGNVTGLTFSGADMAIIAKQLDLLREAIPSLGRVAMLSNASNTNHPRWVKEMEDAGRSLRVHVQVFTVSGPDEFDGAVAAISRARAGAVLVVADSVFIANRTRLAAVLTKARLPSFAQYREIVESGGLMSYAPSLPHLGHRAASYADRILKGTRPADMPVEQPNRLELIVNLKTARALGLTIPQRLLVRADQLIQ